MENTDKSFDNWQKRLDAVLCYVDIVENSISDERIGVDPLNAGPSVPRELTTKHLLNRLHKFGQYLFRFFKYGLDKSEQKGIAFTTHRDIIPSVAFTTILNQIGNDLSVLERAFYQRTNPKLSPTLEIADLIAWDIRKKFQIALDPDTTVLTYFTKSPNVRLTPYAPVALIGVSATSLGHRQLLGAENPFMAIPHEFAHHLYWYGRIPKVEDRNGGTGDDSIEFSQGDLIRLKIKSFLKGTPRYNNEQWVHNWVEEIFCDMVGCYIEGETYVESLQQMLLTNYFDELFKDNGEHPTPIIRPYIALKALNLEPDSANALESEWKKLLKARMDSAQSTPGNEHDITSVEVRRLNEGQEEIVEQIEISEALITLEDLLAELRTIIDSVFDQDYPMKLSQKGRFDDSEIDDSEIMSVDLAIDLGLVNVESFRALWQRSKLDPDSWKEDLQNLLEHGVPLPVKPFQIDDSIQILNFDGWATQGPQWRDP